MLHVKHDFQNICVRKRVLQKIMLHVKRAFQYISLRKRVLHKDALYAKYAFYHFTKLNRRQRLGDGMTCLRVCKWFEGKSFAAVMCLVYLLHSGKRCGCFKCFGVFISPQTCDSFDVQIEVNSLKKKMKNWWGNNRWWLTRCFESPVVTKRTNICFRHFAWENVRQPVTSAFDIASDWSTVRHEGLFF